MATQKPETAKMTMAKLKKAKLRSSNMLATGMKKQEVFDTLCHEGFKEKQAAYLIASHLDPVKAQKNQTHVFLLIAMASIQLLLGLISVYSLTAVGDLPIFFTLVCFLFVILICGAFIYGFAKRYLGAFNTYVMLTLISMPRQIIGFREDPLITLVGLTIGVATAGYVMFVRSKLYPDFELFSPRRVNGKYVFQD
jgi:hypothetical protein